MSGETTGVPWLAARAAATPDAPALVLPDRRLAWSQLDAEARSLADALAAAGVRSGDVVATLLGSGDFAVALHAIWLRGAIVQPLNLRLTASELRFQLEDAGAPWLVHGPGALASRAAGAVASGAVPATLPLEALRAAGRSGGPRGTAPEPGRPLAILYTSGTTGRPKGAVLTAGGFAAGARASQLRLGSGPSDRCLACMPLFHVGGLCILVRSLLQGSCVQVHEGFDPEVVASALERDGVSDVSFVANMLARVLEVRGDEKAPPGLRCVLLGGGPIPAPLEQRARRLGYPLAPTYGLTEATSQVATRAPGDRQARGLRPLPGVEVRVDAAPGGDGEIRVRGPNLMAGYWKRPDETARALRGGWLHTGDVGRLHADGTLEVLDRRSDLIVSGGENVYPAEIESVVAAHPGVSEVGVRGVPDERWGARPAAWFVATPGCVPSEAELRDYCRDRLAGFKRPVAFHRVDRLPRTGAGKLVRARLGEPDAAG